MLVCDRVVLLLSCCMPVFVSVVCIRKSPVI